MRRLVVAEILLWKERSCPQLQKVFCQKPAATVAQSCGSQPLCRRDPRGPGFAQQPCGILYGRSDKVGRAPPPSPRPGAEEVVSTCPLLGRYHQRPQRHRPSRAARGKTTHLGTSRLAIGTRCRRLGSGCPPPQRSKGRSTERGRHVTSVLDFQKF